MIERDALNCVLTTLLQVERFKDYATNGLQIEGKPQIRNSVSGVTASLALMEVNAQALGARIAALHGLHVQRQFDLIALTHHDGTF